MDSEEFLHLLDLLLDTEVPSSRPMSPSILTSLTPPTSSLWYLPPLSTFPLPLELSVETETSSLERSVMEELAAHLHAPSLMKRLYAELLLEAVILLSTAPELPPLALLIKSMPEEPSADLPLMLAILLRPATDPSLAPLTLSPRLPLASVLDKTSKMEKWDTSVTPMEDSTNASEEYSLPNPEICLVLPELHADVLSELSALATFLSPPVSGPTPSKNAKQ